MKSLNLKNLRNKPSFNGFDRSHRNLFTAKVGELLPVCVVEMSPGDKIDYHPQGFTRTQPLETSAFTRIEEHYDSFFVPYRLLWRFANDTFTMTNNAFAAAGASSSLKASVDFPHIKLSSVVADIEKLKPSISSGKYVASPNGVNRFGFMRAPLMCKLANLLGYGHFNGQHYGEVGENASSPWSAAELGSGDVAVTPFRFLAYQKIWADWYRNDNWQSIQPWTYNMDYITPSVASTTFSSFVDNNSLASSTLYDLRYVNSKLDYFTGGLPNSQLGSVATVDVDSGGGVGEISVLSIRQAMFLQKWQEIAQSGNKDYKTQIEKHFGKDVSNVLANKCTFIDGVDGQIVINDVVNTSLNGDSDNADIKGKGVGTTDGKTHFEAPEHGIFMTVYYARPLLDWANYGIDAFNMKTSAEDFAIPELDSIGMQELYCCQFDSNAEPPTSQYGLSQYVPRYFEYKSSYDRVNGEFLNSLKSWSAFWKPYPTISKAQHYVPNPTSLLPVNPACMDSVFGVNANGVTSTDQLLIGLFNDIKLTTCLDVNGLPY